jgi:tRNA-Thr(GGU) m(6)t(6)A37 methyltransferase TsaA
LSEPGEIILNSKNNFEQALQNLKDCSHIWIIYYFHHNQNWKPLVQTPRSENKIGVFATRAPYRPNPIGMSAVQLLSVEGLTVKVGPNDILDGTPILDIKPYHLESDLIANSHVAWLDEALSHKFEIRLSPFADEQFDFLDLNGLKEIRTFSLRQLEYDPTNKDKKRVKQNNTLFELSYRTWRIDFMILENTVSILSLRSGYSVIELESIEDQYQDKDLHRKFNQQFS